MNSYYSRIASDLRDDILQGAFPVGSRLPSVDDLSKRFKVGTFAIRHALAVLRTEGALTIKQHVGAIVTGQHLARRNGRILFITVGRKNNFFDATLAERLSVLIRKAGWEFTDVVIDAVEESERNLSPLRREITYGVDYVIMNCTSQRVASLLDAYKIRYALTRGGSASEFPNADVRFLDSKSDNLYIRQIISQIRQQRIKNILEVDFIRNYNHALTLAFQKEGLHVRRIWGKGRNWKVCGMRLVEQIGHDLIKKYFSNKNHLLQPPDLIVFMDDYLARGGLMALSSLGLKAPTDLKILSQSNRGNPPIYSCKLTRFEYDPENRAQLIAKWTLSRLSDNPVVPAIFPSIRFVKGDTF